MNLHLMLIFFNFNQEKHKLNFIYFQKQIIEIDFNFFFM